MTTTPPDTDVHAQLADLGERYFATEHTYDPYNATLLGIAEFDHLPGDPSEDASERAAADLAAIAEAAAALPVDRLDDAGRVDHGVLTALVRGAQQDAEHSLWAANASAKGYVSRQGLVFQAVPAMTVAGQAAADRYLARIGGLGGTFAALADRYLLEASRGRVPTAMGVRHSIEQLEGYLALPLDDDALLTAVRGTPWFDAARALVDERLRPAMSALAERLRVELHPLARPDDRVGISTIPGGAEGYAAAVARHTTTALTPDEIHRIGLDELELLREQWATIGQRALGLTEPVEIAARLRTDPALRFRTTDEIIGYAQAALDRAEAARPAAFPAYDITACTLEPINPIDAGSSALGYYRPPAVDGSRPGAFCLLADEPEQRYRYEYEALTFHESVPGHHMQLAMAQQLDVPRYRRYLDVEACSFNEGWGLYSEELADELGLYSDDVARLGMLSMRALRACRLVVDTGIHHLGWSREQAVQFMLANTAATEEHVRSEVDRYIAWPGQALAYMIGRREILRLRAAAQGALGDRFDLIRFHDTVLGNGAVPLTVLGGVVTQWQERTAA
ncbi:DUF885 domain-containing protein [Curtobacterium sp. MCBD17_035]|uniref:DUF885 domain-containing protein n=1 Tax=Curtobacterium sp. MCBD17_035 TaxID=2175673 RepID=UPI000DA7364A|nr:DUF885 domain-containing protein [Curtobacterium sp. MCBD17_035]WIB67314.1 DUF885 domain-containing protein [Curtobacterium sp. MCBD17_035]